VADRYRATRTEQLDLTRLRAILARSAVLGPGNR